MNPELNHEQQAVVEAPLKPLIVSAGAGSGKTRTLVCRVAHLIKQGIAPNKIILLTFTNKAAKNMLARVEDLCGSQARLVTGGTFHAVALSYLRQLNPEIKLISRDDSKKILYKLLRNPRLPSVDIAFDKISYAHNTQTRLPEDLELLRKAFQTQKYESGVVDFDDLLLQFKGLLDKQSLDPEAVLVDEYQDTNRLQGQIIENLSQKHQNLMVVGDDSQSIYAFRGADTGNMLVFKKRYPDALHLTLSTNYRSTPEIVNLANSALKRFPFALQKKLLSVRSEGIKPVLVACSTALQQAQFVAQRISELAASGVSLGEIVVLYRAHKHSIEIKEALNAKKIAFQELLPSRDWSLDGQDIQKSQDRVTLSSIHQAKGLEWAHVFVIWLVEGHFPSFMSYKEPNGLEEERRLFYVALTRAKDSLTFCYPGERALRRSRFLEENTGLCETWVLEQPQKPKLVRKKRK